MTGWRLGRLGLLGFFLLNLYGPPAIASEADAYWACVPAASGVQGSFCPASLTNPLPTTGVITGTVAANITQWASGILGAMANYGTSPGAVLAPGVNAFITNIVSTIVSPSSSSTVGIAPVVAGSAVSSSVLKASAGNLYGVYATCTSACWLMVFNATSAPGNGSTTAGIAASGLQDCIPIPAGGSGSINYASGPPEVFSTGITAAISSTACATLTLSTVGYIHGSAQ